MPRLGGLTLLKSPETFSYRLEPRTQCEDSTDMDLSRSRLRLCCLADPMAVWPSWTPSFVFVDRLLLLLWKLSGRGWRSASLNVLSYLPLVYPFADRETEA